MGIDGVGSILLILDPAQVAGATNLSVIFLCLYIL